MFRTLQNLTRPLRALFAWQFKMHFAPWTYLENTVTGQRMAIRDGRFGNSVLQVDWLNRGRGAPIVRG